MECLASGHRSSLVSPPFFHVLLCLSAGEVEGAA